MLQRAAETVSGDDECNDPAVLLACALGSTGCPAKCADAEKNNTDQNPNNAFNGVVAGDLSVAVSTSSSTVSIPNQGIIKVAELAVKASEDIQLQSIDVTRLGLSKNEGVKVWIEKDGRRITSSSSFFGDSKASLTFNNGGYVVKGDETLDLVVSLDGGTKVPAGSEFQFKVSNVVSSAKNSTVSPDTTGMFRTAVYTATSIDIVTSTDTNDYTGYPTIVNNPRSYNLSKDTTFSFGEFKVQNESPASMEKNVMIKSITFKVEGSIENLANFKLLRDSKEVSSKYSIDGKSLTFAVNDQLDSGKAATYKVTAEPTNIENAKGDEYTLTIKKAEDIIAEEIGDNSTAYRVSVTESVNTNAAWGFSNTAWDVVSLGTTKVSGGNITLTKDSSLASTVSADWGYSDVVAAKGTAKVNQAVKFEGAKIRVATVAGIPGALDKVIRRASLVIDGKSYQLTIPDSAFVTDTATADLTTDSEIYLSKGEHNIEFQISLANTDPSAGVIKKITFNSIDSTSFGTANYTNGDETSFNKSASIAGTIKISDVNVAQRSITVKKVGPSEDVKFAAGNSDEVVVLVGEITNNEDKDLEINKFTVIPAAVPTMHQVCTTADVGVVASCTAAWDIIGVVSPSTKELWKLTVTMNDSTSSNVAIFANTSTTDGVSIDSLTTTVAPGKTVKFEVRMIPFASLVANDTFKFKVKVAGKLNGNDTSSSELNSANITATAGATSTVVANTTDNKQIVKPGVSTKVASFTFNVKNDSMDVDTIELAVDGFNASMLDDLTIDFGGNVNTPGLVYADGSATPTDKFYSITPSTIVVKFDNVVTLPVGNYKVNVYATFNNSAIAGTATKYATAAAAMAGTAEAKKAIVWVAINPTNAAKWATVAAATTTTPASATISNTNNANAKAAAALTYGHYVAKAYPILAVKDKNTTAENSRLDISIRKSNDDANSLYIVWLNKYTTLTTPTNLANTWHVVDGSDTVINNISIDANSATVIWSSKAIEWDTAAPAWSKQQKSVSSVSFVVQDDDWWYVYYKDVDAGSDFASLSL